ncbi:MAG: hypothetical protein QOC81_4896 [Thermoanaerobaculia bacterium]|jgi:hypothetical protein|nr:hypothetical protein [Thermoanaerobaculia bacterium]
MKRLALIAAFTILALPAFPSVGPSIDVPVTSPTLARAAGSQRQPHVATDGRDFFAAWLDTRGGYSSVYGTRVLADGTVLDPSGILLSAPEQFCDSFALTWDGANYVVAWQSGSRVSFIRVDRDGRVVGSAKTLFDGSSTPSIASNGHGSVVIARYFYGYNVALISQDGAVTQKPGLAQSWGAQIASNGDGYLLAWADLSHSTTSIIRLDDNGNQVAGSAQQLSDAAYTQLTAGIGGQYLLASRKFSGDDSCARSIVGRLVSNSVLSDPFVIHNAGGADIQDIAVAAEGNGFQVVWMKRIGPRECPYPFSDPAPAPSPPFGLAQIHVSENGSGGASITLTEGGASDAQPAIASNRAAELVVWIEIETTNNSAKIAAAIAHPGEQAVPIPIASSASMQSDPTVAAADGVFMTAWSEWRTDGTIGIYARRFNTDGRALDEAAIKVSVNDQTRAWYPSVSFDGAVWLFVWTADKLLARRMAADGTWIDAAPLAIGNASGLANFAVASNGNGFAVLTLGPVLTTIPRTGAAHQVLLPSVPGDYLTYPSMAWDGTAYVAVWMNEKNHDDIEGIRVDPNGQILTPRFNIATTSRVETNPSIACHEAACVIAWYSNGSVAATNLLDGTLAPFVNGADNVIPLLTDPTRYAVRPQVLATHDGFQILWSEYGGPTPSLFTASIAHGTIGLPTPLGFTGITAAALTPHDQLALTIARPTYDAASGGVQRAFLRVWPAAGRRRAAQP